MCSSGEQSIARQFGTNWFTVVMGVGIVAALMYTSPIHIPGQHVIGVSLFILGNIVFVAAMCLWLLRWFVHTDEARKDFAEPAKVLFYGALAMGINVIGNDYFLIGTHIMDYNLAISISKIIWLSGVVVSLFTVITVPYLLFVHHQVSIEETHASWLIPVVPPIVAAAAGTNLIPYWGVPSIQLLFSVLILAMFGMTFFLFIMISGLYYSRLVYKEKILGGFIPSVWIEIGPIGMAMTIFANFPFATSTFLGTWSNSLYAIGLVFAVAMWGVGVWWIVIASLYSLFHVANKDSGIPYSLGWWSYVFPLGSFTTGTYALNHLLGHDVFAVIGLLQFVLLCGFFALVSVGTISGLWNGSLLRWRSVHFYFPKAQMAGRR